jgi:hypothetical protein
MLGSGFSTTWKVGSALTGNALAVVNNNNRGIY